MTVTGAQASMANISAKPSSGNSSFSSDESPETSHPRLKESPRGGGGVTSESAASQSKTEDFSVDLKKVPEVKSKSCFKVRCVHCIIS